MVLEPLSPKDTCFMSSSCVVSTNRSKSPCRTKTVFRIVSCAFLEDVIFVASFSSSLFFLFANTLLSSSTNWSAVANKPDATHAVINSSSELKPCSCANPIKLLSSGSSSILFLNAFAKCAKPLLAFPLCVEESSLHEKDALLVLVPSLLAVSYTHLTLPTICSV